MRDLEKALGDLQDFYEENSRLLNLTPVEMQFLRSTFHPVDAPSYTAILDSPSFATLRDRREASTHAQRRLDHLTTELDGLIASLSSVKTPFEVERVILKWVALRQRYRRYSKRELETFPDFMRKLASWKASLGSESADAKLAALRMVGFSYTIAFERLISVGYQTELLVKEMFTVVRQHLRVCAGELGACHEAVEEWMYTMARSDWSCFEHRKNFERIQTAVVGAIVSRKPPTRLLDELAEIEEKMKRVNFAPESLAQNLVEDVFDICQSRELGNWKIIRKRQITAIGKEKALSIVLRDEISRCLKITNDEWLLSCAIRELSKCCSAWLAACKKLTAANSDLYDVQSDLFEGWEATLGMRKPVMEILTEENPEEVEEEMIEDVD